MWVTKKYRNADIQIPSTESCDSLCTVTHISKHFGMIILSLVEKHMRNIPYIGPWNREYDLLPNNVIFNQLNCLSQLIKTN